MNLGIEWGEAPPQQGKESKWQKILSEFVVNPGKEGRVPDTYTKSSSASLVYSINKGTGSIKYPLGTTAGDFVAKRAPFGENGRWGVWVKYVGK